MTAVAVVLATACGATTPDLGDPFKVAGMRVTDGPSGLRSGAPKRGNRVASGDGEHGSAFERVSAFQFGFTHGPGTCKRIDEEEISDQKHCFERFP